jgi:phage pi2 protein 07
MFRSRAHHATAKNIVNPPEIRPDAVLQGTIEVFYPQKGER